MQLSNFNFINIVFIGQIPTMKQFALSNRILSGIANQLSEISKFKTIKTL